MSWIKDLVDPKAREWEQLYRSRHQHDRVVRMTREHQPQGVGSSGIKVL